MSKKFDKEIKQKIKDLKIAPSSAVWTKIEASLNDETKKALIIPFWSTTIFKSSIAASVIFLLGGFSTFMFLNDNGDGEISSTNINSTEIKTKNSTVNNNINSNKTIHLNQKLTASNSTNIVNNKSTNKFNSNFKNNNSKNLMSFANVFAKTSKTKKNSEGYSVNDYLWIFDKKENAYNVVLKNEYNNNTANYLEFDKETTTNFMSLNNKEENKKEKIETLELPSIDDNYKQFSPAKKLNYRGFWLGPNVAFNSVIMSNKYYPGGSFGVDLGYDFGGSIGIQSALKYSINSKHMNIINEEGITENYKSEFNGINIPLMIRYKFTKFSKAYSKPLSLNFIGGVEYSYINTLKMNQLGFVLGTEYDFFTQADLMFTFGIKGGIYNNYNLDKIIAYENIDRFNYNLNAYLSFRFIDWAKKK